MATHLESRHVAGHYRTDHTTGQVHWVPDHEAHRHVGASRPSTERERAAVGRNRAGEHYIRFASAADARAARQHAERLGHPVEQRRTGGNHHGRAGAYEHLFFADPAHAVAVYHAIPHAPASAQPEPQAPEPVAQVQTPVQTPVQTQPTEEPATGEQRPLDDEFEAIFGKRLEAPAPTAQEVDQDFAALFGEIHTSDQKWHFGSNVINRTDNTAESVRKGMEAFNRRHGATVSIRGDAREFATHWNNTMKCDFGQWLEDLFGDFHNEQLGLSIAINERAMTFNGSSDKIDTLTRNYDFMSKTASHSYFAMKAAHLETSHGARFLGRSMDYYLHAGLKKVKVCAALSAGGYAWGRYGFLNANGDNGWQNHASELRRRLDELTRSPQAVQQWATSRQNAGYPRFAARIREKAHLLQDARQVREFRALLDRPDKKAQWDACDHPLGSLVFPGSSFQGVIDLTNDEQMTRFQRYAGRGGQR